MNAGVMSKAIGNLEYAHGGMVLETFLFKK
jgi:hypothetical protein